VTDHNEDDGESRPPPDPLDRLWFHPSELRSFAPLPAEPSRRRGVRWIGPVVAGAVVVGFTVLIVVAALDGSGHSPISTGVTGFQSNEATARMIVAAGASVVTVQVARADGSTTASGVCVSKGAVLTSARALEGATAITLVTADGTSLPALDGGRDPETDLALLRVQPTALPVAQLGSSEQLREGSPVLALAAGSEERQWVSAGSLSAFNELAVTPAGTVVAGLMDTETGAGRLHAGGAVLDPRGAVVGILTAPADDTPSGLAVPIDVARDVARQLAATGSVTHAWLGVVGTDDKDRASGGARVALVAPASPAERAGLVAGDVIVAIGEGESTTSVSDMAELMGEVRRRRPGDSFELTIRRDGGQRRVPVALGDQTGDHPTDASATATTAPAAAP
jgi:S1-C subfamily serine protease